MAVPVVMPGPVVPVAPAAAAAVTGTTPLPVVVAVRVGVRGSLVAAQQASPGRPSRVPVVPAVTVALVVTRVVPGPVVSVVRRPVV